MGIEPTLRAWEAPVLPLNYTRIKSKYSMGFVMGSPVDWWNEEEFLSCCHCRCSCWRFL